MFLGLLSNAGLLATLVRVQTKKGIQRRKEWAEKGGSSCEHPVLDKEYDLGGDTGDLICTTCGEVWRRDDPKRPGTARYPNQQESS
jgi:hypothetical protein